MKIKNFIYTYLGIHLTVAKKAMVESRLQKRVKELNLKSFKHYLDFIASEKGEEELIYLTNEITTNKTDFFRENHHFEFMYEKILPTFQANRKIRIWSAGCSSGEEPYSIAMTLSEFISNNYFIDTYLIGTDISSSMIYKCRDAIYASDRLLPVPNELKVKYFLKNKNPNTPTVRVTPELRKKVIFDYLNFMDDTYNKVNGYFDVIFCRNVIIYFDKKTQEEVITKLCKKLNKGGYLFLGHSESIIDFNFPLEQIRPTIFRKI